MTRLAPLRRDAARLALPRRASPRRSSVCPSPPSPFPALDIPGRGRAARASFVGAVFALGVLIAPLAQATDRPYLFARTATVEDDDDRTWHLATWLEHGRGDDARREEWRTELEYNFDPRTSLQFEFSALRTRLGDDRARERSLEVELKKVFLDPRREAIGLAGAASLEWERGDDGTTRLAGSALYLPATMLFPEAGVALHVNGGIERATGDRWRARWATAGEVEVTRRVSLLAEAGGIAGRERLLHAGVRWWLKRERVAIDVGVGQRRVGMDDARTTLRFGALGLAFYDLHW